MKSKIHLKNIQNLDLDFQIQKMVDNIIAEYITEKSIPLSHITSIKYLINDLVDINFISYDSNAKIKGRDSITRIINNIEEFKRNTIFNYMRNNMFNLIIDEFEDTLKRRIIRMLILYSENRCINTKYLMIRQLNKLS